MGEEDYCGEPLRPWGDVGVHEWLVRTFCLVGHWLTDEIVEVLLTVWLQKDLCYVVRVGRGRIIMTRSFGSVVDKFRTEDLGRSAKDREIGLLSFVISAPPCRC